MRRARTRERRARRAGRALSALAALFAAIALAALWPRAMPLETATLEAGQHRAAPARSEPAPTCDPRRPEGMPSCIHADGRETHGLRRSSSAP
jgi:hypothetical protein